MALGNWSLFAIDENGKPTNGIYASPIGTTVEIYKNWLYLHNKSMWRKNSHYAKDTIAEIWSGEFIFQDISILAKRGSKNGIYFICWDKNYKTGTLHSMIGIGCYGYDNDKWVGIEKTDINELKLYINEWLENSYPFIPDEIKELVIRGTSINQGSLYFAQRLQEFTK